MKKAFLLIAFLWLFVGCPEGKGNDIDVAPKLALIGQSEVFFNVGGAYIEYGYVATDVNGNDVTSLVRRDTSSLNMGKEGVYQISYVAVDRKGVKSDPVYRTVNVGNAFGPEIRISGANPLLVGLDSDFTPPSATAIAYDGTDLSDRLRIDADSVDTSLVGTYTVAYEATDNEGVTTTALLSVYVLESNTPRILLTGKGANEENPYLIQKKDDTNTTATEEYLKKKMPFIPAYDLEDGDISYKVTIVNNEQYTKLISALDSGDEEIIELSLTVSDSDKNVPNPLPSFFVKVIADTTPPEITFGVPAKDNKYEFTEWTVWGNDSSAWSKFLIEKIDPMVWDNSWTNNQSPVHFSEIESNESETDFNGFKVIINDNTVTDVMHLNGDRNLIRKKDENGNFVYYDYENPSNETNTKHVTFTAIDKAGNESSVTIGVFLKDTVAPVILEDKDVHIPFGTVANNVPGYALKFKDNSGLEGTCSGLEAADVGNARVAGEYSRRIIARDYTGNSVNYILGDQGKKKLYVDSPVKKYSNGNYFTNGGFDCQSDAVDREKFENLAVGSPNGWTQNFATLINIGVFPQGTGPCSEWKSGFSGGDLDFSTVVRYDRNIYLCAAFTHNSTGKSAFMTRGLYYIGTNTWFKNVQQSIQKTCETPLYQDLTYQLQFDLLVFRNIENNDGQVDGGKRGVTLVKNRGGKFNTSDFLNLEHIISKNSDKIWNVRNNNKKEDDQYLFQYAFGGTVPGGIDTCSDKWSTYSSTFIVKDADIASYDVFYYCLRPGKSDDYGSLVRDIQIIPIEWPAKQSLNGPVGFGTYDIETKTESWRAK